MWWGCVISGRWFMRSFEQMRAMSKPGRSWMGDTKDLWYRARGMPLAADICSKIPNIIYKTCQTKQLLQCTIQNQKNTCYAVSEQSVQYIRSNLIWSANNNNSRDWISPILSLFTGKGWFYQYVQLSLPAGCQKKAIPPKQRTLLTNKKCSCESFEWVSTLFYFFLFNLKVFWNFHLIGWKCSAVCVLDMLQGTNAAFIFLISLHLAAAPQPQKTNPAHF